MSTAHLMARVHDVTTVAEGIRRFELHPAGPAGFPAWRAGAHIALHLAPGLTRSYSLCGDPADLRHYAIAVALEPQGRGGSRHLFERVSAGQTLAISAPANHFAMSEEPALSVFVAGGIGITPLWSMIQNLRGRSAPWVLHYAARSRAQAAFVNDIESFARHHGGTVVTHFSDNPARQRLDVDRVISTAPDSAHFYCCGPQRLIDAFEKAARGRSPAQVHVEHFRAEEPRGARHTFTVALARSGLRLQVPAGQTVLEVIEAAGVNVPWSCREGVCGACEVGVLDGTPEHHDHVLSAEERAQGRSLMVCCSGALSDELVLDL